LLSLISTGEFDIMSGVQITTRMQVSNISTQLTSPGTAFENPPIYLWSVFFKVDGSTVQINATNPSSFTLQGTATVVPTPGDHGDLPGGVQASFYLAETTAIPASLGTYTTTLIPFPVSGLSNVTVGGMIVGWLGILLYQENTPADDIAAGHQALNGAVQQALNNVIPTISSGNPMITPAQIAAATTLVRSQIVSAITNALSIWNKLATVLNTEFQDTYVGTVLQYFTDTQLLGSPPQGLPINYQFDWGGTDDPNLYEFTINGTVLANFAPYSLFRVLTGLGYSTPASLRAVMGGSATPSVLAWIESVP
jgi:hypothetical protein